MQPQTVEEPKAKEESTPKQAEQQQPPAMSAFGFMGGASAPVTTAPAQTNEIQIPSYGKTPEEKKSTSEKKVEKKSFATINYPEKDE